MATGFCTIGHSNRPLDEFGAMLAAARIGELVDVRRFPRSRSNPAYNIETLPDWLAARQIGYRHAAALGGRRGGEAVPPETNALWRNRSFHNYADHAMSDAFQEGLHEVIALGARRRVALMCAEAVWWRCHRRIIADHLLLRGHEVLHLMAPGRSEAARPTPGAVLGADGRVTYPAAA